MLSLILILSLNSHMATPQTAPKEAVAQVERRSPFLTAQIEPCIWPRCSRSG